MGQQGCTELPSLPPPSLGGNRIKLLGKNIKWRRREGEGKKERERSEAKGGGKRGKGMEGEGKGK